MAMTVNNGGNLSSEYFSAYLKHIMIVRDCSLVGAQEYMVKHFFKGDINSFGKYSSGNFLKSVEELTLG